MMHGLALTSRSTSTPNLEKGDAFLKLVFGSGNYCITFQVKALQRVKFYFSIFNFIF